MSNRHHHNTTDLGGSELAQVEAKAKSQDERVLDYMKGAYPNTATAEDVHTAVLPGSPRTSAGRALSNLQKRGLVEKTGVMAFGKFGSKINRWRLVIMEQPDLFLGHGG